MHSATERKPVYWVLTGNVADGKLDDFKALVHKIVAQGIAEREPGALEYGANVAADGKSVQIFERYSNSAAVVTHIDNLGKSYLKEFLALLKPTSLVVYGHPDEFREEGDRRAQPRLSGAVRRVHALSLQGGGAARRGSMHVTADAATEWVNRAAPAARAASALIARLDAAARNAALRAAAAALRDASAAILAANAADLAAFDAAGGTAAFRDRLLLTPARVAAMADGAGNGRGPARPARSHAGRLDAAERLAHRAASPRRSASSA